jgi:DNA-binding NtrC family response regulator
MAKVLLVDDDVDLQEMNRLVLGHKGHQVILAYSAVEARAVLGQGQPDIVVLDVVMESSTAGIELAGEMHERFPDMPVIMLTGIRGKVDPPQGFELDVSKLPVMKFLDKPVPAERLANEIEGLLSDSHRTK